MIRNAVAVRLYQTLALSVAYLTFSVGSAHAQATTPCPNTGNPLSVSNCYNLDIGNQTLSAVTTSGDITASTASGGGTPVWIHGSTITTLTNNGAIRNWFQYGGSGVYIDSSTVSTFDNTGSIRSDLGNAVTVVSGASIGTINNTGTIYANHIGGDYASAGINNAGTITTIINTGSLLSASGATTSYGINNTGTITTLSNGQSGLTYNGALPGTYNVIITGSGTGTATFSNPSGATNFGIYASSFSLGQNTYNSIISGLGTANINAASRSGTYGGGLFNTTYTLSNPSGTNWDLATNTSNASINTGTNSGNSLASAAASAAVGSAGSTTLVNGTTVAAAAQSLTAAQANQLSNVHAEGYSSNMTIGLEQMAHITNTVMDRIHNPLSNRAGTSTAYEMDQGKYLWFDAAAVKGSVNSYDGLAGFGYNLYDAVIGGDIMRDSSGGLGLYVGAGYTTMTEPAQVSQNFNTTNYYAGLYGGKYLPYNFKLSGALGYMYGETNASRNNPNVGLFTGGTANSNYGTNGVYGAFKFSRPFQASESLTLTPYVGASYSQLWMGQANESGGGDFSYNISNATAYTTVTFVGGEFIVPLTGVVKNPMSLVGFYRFGYDWFANSAYAHSITANSSKFGSFNQVGADMGPALNLGGLGVQGNITKSLSGRIGVVGSANTNGWQIGGGGELKWAL